MYDVTLSGKTEARGLVGPETPLITWIIDMGLVYPDLCGGPQLQDSDLLQVSKAVSNASSRGFPDYFRLAHAAAIWGFPSVQVRYALHCCCIASIMPFM